jgi:hypothetical protein
MSTQTTRVAVGVGAALALALTACGGDDNGSTSAATETTETTEATETTEPAAPAQPVIDPGDGGDYAPDIDPANFVTGVDNPYLPFAPGARWVYEGTDDGENEHIEVTVTDERREVMGIPVVVVRDTVELDGELAEDTRDWYAQDREGNVWYMGEETAEYENGEVTSTEGSWEAGVDGALPGIVMPAHPEVGQAYRQEFYEGEAEDLGEILRVDGTASVAAGEFHELVVTRDWNPFEPEVVEEKSYARGVGVVLEEKVEGGDGRIELIEFDPAT